MAEIGRYGEGSITPREKKLYTLEYQHGIQLFQKALQHYSQSDNPFQKEEFKQVMDKAMHVLNEMARELKAKNLLEQNEKISKDYTVLINEPANKKAIEILTQDLEKAKKIKDFKGR